MAIRIHADAVISLIDGFSGMPLESGGAVAELDGGGCSPVRKPGALVLVNTPAGQHRLTITMPHFAPVKLEFGVDGSSVVSLAAVFSPDRTYPLPMGAVRAWGRVKAGDMEINSGKLLYGMTAGAVKLAQDKAGPGDEKITLFSKALLRTPQDFMLEGGEPERIRVMDSGGKLEAPLKNSHKRGEAMIPIREFELDGKGYYICLPWPGETAFYYCEDGKWRKCVTELSSGDNPDKEIVFK